MVCSRVERVFILEHYFASKSFAAVHEEFSNASSSDKTAEITAVPISSSASAATTGYGC
jgi:hypothetical protein